MKKFVLKTAPYVCIGICYALLGEYFLYKHKESFSLETIAAIQSNSESELYYGREILGNSLSNYKFKMFQNTQPKVLVLGQSVMLQFRDFMFEPYQNDFYNTGLMARNHKDLNYVLDLIENGEIKKPELVFLGVDISFVLKNTILDKREWVRTFPEDRATSIKSHLKGIQRIYFNPEFREISEIDAGFGKAGRAGRGYRNDGSYRHSPEIYEYLKDSVYYDGVLIDKLKTKSAPFIEPFEFDITKAKELLTVLNRIESLGIELLLYIPPYSDVYYTEAISDAVFKSFWKDYIRFQGELIEKGYDVISFTTPKQMGLTDDYMVDAEHPSEVMNALQLESLVSSRKAKGKLLRSLTFKTVDQLLESETTVPISFLNDSLDKQLVEEIKSIYR